MRKRFFGGVLLAAMLETGGVLAAPLVATFADTVEPDAELRAFLVTLVETAQAGIGTQSRAYAVLDEMIALDLRGFGRGLDPFEPWQEVDLSGPDEGTGVDLLARHMVETGDFIEGGEMIDPRQGWLELVVALVGNPDEPLGTMAEMGDAVCSPARLDFDRKGAEKFAAAQDTDGYSISIYPRPVDLQATPREDAAVVATLAPRTLLVADYAAEGPEGWGRLVASDGTTGWTPDRGDYENLSQQHLCFGKVDGAYKIVGFFTYGL